MTLSTDPKEAGRFTPSQASVMLTLALTKILSGTLQDGEADYLADVIQDEAINYLAAWGHGVTKKDRARVRLLEEDEGGKLFRYITDTLMVTESVVMDIREIARTAHVAGHLLVHEDMVAIEAVISAESWRRRGSVNVEVQSSHPPRDQSPYC